jgi:hypothetical protein
LAEIPSLVDIFTVIVLIVPGFFSFIIANSFIPRKRTKLSDLETTIFCLMYALPILVSYGLITGVSGIDAIRDSIFQTWNLAILFGLSFVWGLGPGLIAWILTRKDYVVGECWDEFGKRLGKGAYVMVYTDKGQEYKGWIHFFDLSEEKQSIILGDPKLILRDKNWEILNEIEVGHEMLFAEKDIGRIVSLTPFEKEQ